jgi:hypothetical protein
MRKQSFNPNLRGVMLSAWNSPSDCRFDSLRLNLAFEGLLLGVSLRHCAKGTDSEPHELSLKHVEGVYDAFAHPEGTLLYFWQESRGIRGPWAELTR